MHCTPHCNALYRASLLILLFYLQPSSSLQSRHSWWDSWKGYFVRFPHHHYQGSFNQKVNYICANSFHGLCGSKKYPYPPTEGFFQFEPPPPRIFRSRRLDMTSPHSLEFPWFFHLFPPTSRKFQIHKIIKTSFNYFDLPKPKIKFSRGYL